MEKQGKRTSERIELEVPIEVVGIDCLGVQFFDRTHTVVIGRHGGKLRFCCSAAPGKAPRTAPRDAGNRLRAHRSFRPGPG